MKIHTVFITHNRLELTKQALVSYLETVTVPFTFSIVDNASTDGTREWMHSLTYGALHSRHWLDENHYPGYAANLGWTDAPADATHLHRADNDFVFLPNWCEEVKRLFNMPHLGQVGLRTNEEEAFNQNNVGGNCVVKRELWDEGLRYDERPWPQIAVEVGRGWSEDSLLSPQIKAMGYRWTRVKRSCIRPIGHYDANDPYYVRSLGDRGVTL